MCPNHWLALCTCSQSVYKLETAEHQTNRIPLPLNNCLSVSWLLSAVLCGVVGRRVKLAPDWWHLLIVETRAEHVGLIATSPQHGNMTAASKITAADLTATSQARHVRTRPVKLLCSLAGRCDKYRQPWRCTRSKPLLDALRNALLWLLPCFANN